jgi:C1A family cysteine protease
VTMAFRYLIYHDFCLADSYEYTGKDKTCKVDSCEKHYRAIYTFQKVTQNSTIALKTAIYKGPVAIAVEADNQSFKFYLEGVVNDYDNCGSKLDHGVLAVGYGTDSDGTDYYIIKNSWSASWGEAGYFKIGTNSEIKGGV